jgi:hypothetical protein
MTTFSPDYERTVVAASTPGWDCVTSGNSILITVATTQRPLR